jgi:nicotinamidase/pyrazinamidase
VHGRKPFEEIDMLWGKQVLWPDHCVAGTEGALLHRGLDQRPLQAIFRKGANPGIESYSGFENALGQKSGLSEFLGARGVREVDVVGLALDYCVGQTAIDARRRGFITRILEQHTASVGDSTAMRKRLTDSRVEVA